MHALITGASSGIGEALAREFAAAGYQLTLAARRRELLEKLAAELAAKHQTRVHLAQVDLSDPTRAAALVAEAETALGPIDLLINNAGQQFVGRTELADLDKVEGSVRLNLFTPLRLCHAVLPAMLARKAGAIVNIASLAGLAPTPYMTWYNAAKGGLGAASEALRGELRKSGVGVVTVYPGPVHTAMAHAANDAYGDATAVKSVPWGTTEVLARKIRAAVEGRRARVIYPGSYRIARHFPNLTRWMLDRMTPAPEAAKGG